jgi:hypothetical protein
MRYPFLLAVLAFGVGPNVAIGQTGTLYATPSWNAAFWPRSIAVADLDGDGRDEAVTACSDSGTLRVFRGTASGLAQGGVVVTNASPRKVFLVDADGDGWRDAVVWHSGSGGSGVVGVSIHRGNLVASGPTFDPPSWVVSGVALRDVAITDLDRDGLPDVATVGSLTGTPFQNAVNVSRNLGGLAFAAPVALPQYFGKDVQAVAAGDVDADGIPDLVASVIDAFITYRGLASGVGPQFSAPTFAGIAPGVTFDLALVALDGGNLDVVSVENFNARVAFGAGDGTFGPPTATSFAYPWIYAEQGGTIGDVDLDGRPEIVQPLLGGRVAVIDVESGSLAPRIYVCGPTLSACALGDFDGDGDVELVGAIGNSITVIPSNGQGGLLELDSHPVGQDGRALATGDIDLDGDVDVVTAGTGVVLLRNEGQGGLAKSTLPPLQDLANVVAIADCFGDGLPDVVGAGSGTATILRQTSPGQFAPQMVTHGGMGSAIGTADLDGDGIADLLIGNSLEHRIAIFRGTPSGFLPPSFVALPNQVRAFAVANLDGDAFVDVAVATSAGLGSQAGALVLLFGDGAGGFASTTVLNGAREQVVAADIDLDGDVDLVTGNDPEILHNDGAGGFASSAYSALSKLSLIGVADVEHDGDLDVIALGGPAGTQALAVHRNDGSGSLGPEYYGAPNLQGGVSRLVDLDGTGVLDVVTPVVKPDASSEVVVMRGAGDASACQGSIVSYGAGCLIGVGTAVPALVVTGCAIAGGAIELDVAIGDPSATSCLLLLGTSQSAIPFPNGCTLLAAPMLPSGAIFVPLVPREHFSGIEILAAIPPQASGVSFTLQALVFGSSGNPPFGATNGIAIAIP